MMISLKNKKPSLGFRMFWYDTVTSTNDVLKQMAIAGEEEGAVVVAESQTKGRGRLARNWFSPMGQGLYVSILLRPRLVLRQTGILPILAAAAVARSIDRLYSVRPQIKWPNDILLRGRKLAGILCECQVKSASLFVILGIGINMHLQQEEFPADLRNHSISLKTVKEKQIDKHLLLQAILKDMNRLYPTINGESEKIIRQWLKYCGHLNCEVVVTQTDLQITGNFKGITKNGAALIELPTSEIITVENGEFSLQEKVKCY